MGKAGLAKAGLVCAMLTAALPLLAGCASQRAPAAGLSRENKALLLNAAAAGAVLTWGALTWDYGQYSPRFRNEGWLGRTTRHGGADKLGHLYFGYAFSHLFAGQYQHWGYSEDAAIGLGVLSSLGIMGLVEVGDSFSTFGFSYQDMAFNVLGAGIGYALWHYPELGRKIDLRIQYNPFGSGKHQTDVTTDYERLKYLLAIKGDGFAATENTFLRYLEVHVGVFARGYADPAPTAGDDPRRRSLYLGIGLNITKLIQPYWETSIFNYIQVPYTDATVSGRLD